MSWPSIGPDGQGWKRHHEGCCGPQGTIGSVTGTPPTPPLLRDDDERVASGGFGHGEDPPPGRQRAESSRMAAPPRTCRRQHKAAGALLGGGAGREDRGRRDPAPGASDVPVSVLRLQGAAPRDGRQLPVRADRLSPGALQPQEPPRDGGSVPAGHMQGQPPDPGTGAVQVQRVGE